MKYNKLILILFALFSMSCASIGSDVRLFLVRDNSLQYFFPSREWDLDLKSGDPQLEVDWLYRNYIVEDFDEPQSTLNFSLKYTETLYQSIPEKVMIVTNGFQVLIPREQISIVYVDHKITRFTMWLYSSELELLMKHADEEGMELIITMGGHDDLQFNSPADFDNHIAYFKEVVLGILSE